MPKRGNNIYKRKDGRWEGRYSKGKHDNGKLIYGSVYGPSYKIVKDKLATQTKVNDNSYPKHPTIESISIKELIHLWLNENKYLWKDSTYALYSGIATRHIIPDIGCCNLADFTTMEYHMFYNKKLNSGAINSSDGLSHSYLKQINIIINQTLKYAHKQYSYVSPSIHYINKPTEKSSIKQPSYEEIQILNTYLKQNYNSPTCLSILLCVYTGIRLGELCALKWSDIDLVEGLLHINKTMQRVSISTENHGKTKIIITSPKSSTSNRVIPIPIDILNILRNNTITQNEYFLKGTKKEFVEPRTLQYRFTALLKKLQIQHYNFHALRHVFASTCVINGFDIKSLSELLGHSDIQTTLNIYVHSNMAHKKSLMENLSFNYIN